MDDDWELSTVAKVAELSGRVESAGRAADALAASRDTKEMESPTSKSPAPTLSLTRRALPAGSSAAMLDDDDDHWEVPVPSAESAELEPAPELPLPVALRSRSGGVEDGGDGLEALETSLRPDLARGDVDFDDLRSDDGDDDDDDDDGGGASGGGMAMAGGEASGGDGRPATARHKKNKNKGRNARRILAAKGR